MEDLLSIWLYQDESRAIEELHEYEMSERAAMAAKAKEFANWLAAQNKAKPD